MVHFFGSTFFYSGYEIPIVEHRLQVFIGLPGRNINSWVSVFGWVWGRGCKVWAVLVYDTTEPLIHKAASIISASHRVYKTEPLSNTLPYIIKASFSFPKIIPKYLLVSYYKWVFLKVGDFFLWKYCRRTHRAPEKVIFSLYISRTNGDHEWLRMINAFILCDLLKFSNHAANREGSFCREGSFKYIYPSSFNVCEGNYFFGDSSMKEESFIVYPSWGGGGGGAKIAVKINYTGT